MFFSIPNLRASLVSAVPEPWTLKTETPPPYAEGKAAVIDWCNRFETKHAMLSVYEGLSPEVRVTMEDNPPFQMHGLICDYDAPLPDNPVEHIKSKRPGEFLPSHLVHTASGNGRLIWQFAKPVLFSNQAHMKNFVRGLSKQLKLTRWLGGLDTEALTHWVKYYELGTKWETIDADAKIPAPMLSLWFYQAASGVSFDTEKKFSYNIPIEELAREVEARYPGRWRGQFAYGARGIRFWAPEADNETAAVIMPDGVLAYTGDKPFLSWKQLLGAAFVEQYEAEAINGIVENAAYDGQKFWIQNEPGHWAEISKDDFSQHLRVQGKDFRKKPGQTASEIDVIENHIKLTRRVRAALPFMFFPSGIIIHDHHKFLNTSRVRPLTPAVPSTERPMPFSAGRTHFPFIYKLLRNMFTEQGDDESEQLTAFLVWLKYAYVNALEMTPKPGHTIVIAGPAGKGKTFLSWQVISRLLGGRADAASHLVDGDRWTERLVEKPVMTIDDSSALTDDKHLREFTNKVKRYTANAEMLFDQKYEKTGNVPWFGRIVITCNLDAESLRILPDMEVSTKDKVCLFKASDAKVDFGDWQENDRIVGAELPHFARFLVEWPYPAEWVSPEKRFGVKTYHHPDLFEESRRQGIGFVLEMVSGFLEAYCQTHPEKEYWEGTNLQLCADLAAMYPGMAKEIKYNTLSRQLGKVVAAGYNIFKIQDPETKKVTWKIHRDIFHKLTEKERL